MTHMGRFLLGVGILVLFLVAGLWISYSMDSVHQTISQTLDDAAACSLNGDLAEGITLAGAAQQQWQRHWHGTAAVADHAPMDEIDGLFAQLETYGKAGHCETFAAYCARLSQLVSAMGEAHSLNWWNLL